MFEQTTRYGLSLKVALGGGLSAPHARLGGVARRDGGQRPGPAVRSAGRTD